MQNLLAKPKFDAACKEYESVWPGFHDNWKALKAGGGGTRRGVTRWLRRYHALASKKQFDERVQRVPSAAAADTEEASVAKRREVSSWAGGGGWPVAVAEC